MTRGRAGRTAASSAVIAMLLAACTSSPTPTASTTSTAPVATPTASATSPTPTPSSASPSSSPSPTASPAAASCPGGFTQQKLRTCVGTARDVYVATWLAELQGLGVTTAKPPRTRIFSSPPTNPCIDLGETDAVEASFWCGKDGTIYVSAFAAKEWTKAYAQAAKRRGVLASDAATAGTSQAKLLAGYPLVGTTTELAHELGHWVQEVTGQYAWYEKRIASADFDVSNKAKATSELAADCMAGWVQGRTAVDGTWVDTGIGAWAHRATMAELGFDIDNVKAGFRFPPEKPADIIGYGSSYTRLKMYDVGDQAGRTGKPGLSTCTKAAATHMGSPLPPMP